MSSEHLEALLAALPKAELHLHLEGSIAPTTLVELAARHGVTLTPAEALARYSYRDFAGFLEAFKWATSLLREPADYGLITERLTDELLRQNVVYAEVTVSVGVMLLRKQDVEKTFAAIRDAGRRALAKGLRLGWIFDAAWQFGPNAALEVARLAAQRKAEGVVAFGMGGDELALPYSDFREVYEYAAKEGLHRLAHAGEIGGAHQVREAIELLGAERIGHGLAAMHDPALMDLLAERGIALENCPSSNLSTGALAKQLGKTSARVEEHPLKLFFDRGLRVTLSTDDPAMFHTDLLGEYRQCARMGLGPRELTGLAEASFLAAFLPTAEKNSLLEEFRKKTKAARLI